MGDIVIKPLFLRRSSILARFGAWVLLACLLMVVDHHSRQGEAIRAALSVVVYPIQYIVNLPVIGGRLAVETVATRQELMGENERLRAQNLLLKTRLQKFAALESENMRLRELLESSKEVGERALVADVLGVGTEPASRQIILNKGSQHGVFLGQPVVDADGVTGQITHVGPFTSTAMLITNPSHALPVQVNRNGVRAIAVGGGADDVLQLNFVPNNADIRIGDLLISSGLGGRFPAGYPAGEVISVNRNTGGAFAAVTVAPSAKLARSQQVLLLWPQEQPAAVAGLAPSRAPAAE
ncbi:MAG: rod shape-determining protein MreC [Chromatiales bacterium]